MKPIAIVMLAACATSALSAQSGAVAGMGAIYTVAKNNVTKAAEQMSEENYAFKPTPEVRSFGQLVGHVANANFMICSMALGEKNPNATDFEKTSAKAALVQGIRDSFTYCDKAYAMPDATGMQEATLFGMKTNKMGILSFNSGHDMEHYGNMVTYFRLKGMVPPSSQQGM